MAVVVAGFVASDDQWVQFERNWNNTLRQFGISLFHMREFAHSVGEFSKFKGNREDREWFLRQLLSHIKLRVRHSCGHAVLMDDYRLVNRSYALDLSGFTLYALCGRTCVTSISDWAKRSGVADGEIQYIFEDGAKGRKELKERVLKDKSVTVVFKKKHECVPLQAADLLAYEHLAGNRAIFEKGVKLFRELRYPLKQLAVRTKDAYDWGTYNREYLEKFCKKAGIIKRDTLAVGNSQ